MWWAVPLSHPGVIQQAGLSNLVLFPTTAPSSTRPDAPPSDPGQRNPLRLDAPLSVLRLKNWRNAKYFVPLVSALTHMVYLYKSYAFCTWLDCPRDCVPCTKNCWSSLFSSNREKLDPFGNIFNVLSWYRRFLWLVCLHCITTKFNDWRLGRSWAIRRLGWPRSCRHCYRDGQSGFNYVLILN